jgi:DEAD/DEAH box helicase domain-containing protein
LDISKFGKLYQNWWNGCRQPSITSGSTILDAVDLETPPFMRETTGTWIDVPKGIIKSMRMKGLNPAEGIHAAQHAILNRFSMAKELRTECKAPQKEYAVHQTSRKRPARLIFFDKGGEGAGVAAKAFDIGRRFDKSQLNPTTSRQL